MVYIVAVFFIAMSDHSDAGSHQDVAMRPPDQKEDEDVPGSSNEDCAKRPHGEEVAVDQPQAGQKRPRGPYDCLDWSDEEEEFTPFTQSYSPPKVFAKKSAAKSVAKKKRGAKNAGKVKGSSTNAKGKSLGKALISILCRLFNLFYVSNYVFCC